METLPKEFLREMSVDRNLKTGKDLHLYLKEKFKDVLQSLLLWKN